MEPLQMNPVCWFEIYVRDMERAKIFYSTVLKQDITDCAPESMGAEDMKMAFFPSAMNVPNASGALVQMPESSTDGMARLGTIVYFGCADCSIEESRVVAAGGQVQQPKFSIGEHGFCSICLDTEGNTFGLYSMT